MLATEIDPVKPLEMARDLGGSVFLAALVLVLAFLAIMLYIYKIAIPKQRTEEKLAEHLAETTAAIGRVVGENHVIVLDTRDKVNAVEHRVNTMIGCTNDVISIGNKISKQIGVDISEEVGTIKGRLLAIKHVDERI